MPGPIQLVFGTRPEAIKLAPLVAELRRFELPVSVVVTGQHREMLDQVLNVFGIKPDFDLDLMTANQTLEGLTARLLTGLSSIYEASQPACVVVQGDTTTAMTAALAAFYRKIPIAHVEAGLRSGNMLEPWPEEGNRKIVGTIADWHFAPTARAAAALRRENVPAEAIFTTGNTVVDALQAVSGRLERNEASAPEADEVLAWAGGRRLVLVTCHRRENFGSAIENIAAALVRIAAQPNVALVLPVHPNPNVRRVIEERLGNIPSIKLAQPFSYLTMVRLLSAATLVITDSGGLQEEAPAFGKPVLVLRNTTERPEGIDAGTALLVGTEVATITHHAVTLLTSPQAYDAMARAHNPFGDGTACRQITDILMDRLCLNQK